MREGKRYLAVGLAAAALLAGCGDDDAPIEPVGTSADTTEEGTTLSQDEFITSADARCAESNAALANLSTEGSAATSATQQERSITQGLLRGLRSIGEPDDPDGSLASFYSALEEQVSVLKQQEQAIATGDTAAADALDTELDAAKTEAASAAEQYGFEDCGQEGTALADTPTTTTGGDVPTSTTPAPVTTAPTPTTPAPVTPAPVEPVTPPDTSGGTSPSSGGTSGGSSGGGASSGGFSP